MGNVAKNIGLVDELGGLTEAIKAASKIANLKDYKVVNYPKVKSFEESILAGLSGDEQAKIDPKFVRDYIQESVLGSDIYKLIKTVKEIEACKGVQMRLPYEILIK